MKEINHPQFFQARVAGKISVEQLRIAMKLGDEIIITQCKLYFSLSLIQRGYCKGAKKIILEQYHALKNKRVVDKKTLNMCKGIWARLKYELFLRRTLNIPLESKTNCKQLQENQVYTIPAITCK